MKKQYRVWSVFLVALLLLTNIVYFAAQQNTDLSLGHSEGDSLVLGDSGNKAKEDEIDETPEENLQEDSILGESEPKLLASPIPYARSTGDLKWLGNYTFRFNRWDWTAQNLRISLTGIYGRDSSGLPPGTSPPPHINARGYDTDWIWVDGLKTYGISTNTTGYNLGLLYETLYYYTPESDGSYNFATSNAERVYYSGMKLVNSMAYSVADVGRDLVSKVADTSKIEKAGIFRVHYEGTVKRSTRTYNYDFDILFAWDGGTSDGKDPAATVTLVNATGPNRNEDPEAIEIFDNANFLEMKRTWTLSGGDLAAPLTGTHDELADAQQALTTAFERLIPGTYTVEYKINGLSGFNTPIELTDEKTFIITTPPLMPTITIDRDYNPTISQGTASQDGTMRWEIYTVTSGNIGTVQASGEGTSVGKEIFRNLSTGDYEIYFEETVGSNTGQTEHKRFQIQQPNPTIELFGGNGEQNPTSAQVSPAIDSTRGGEVTLRYILRQGSVETPGSIIASGSAMEEIPLDLITYPNGAYHIEAVESYPSYALGGTPWEASTKKNIILNRLMADVSIVYTEGEFNSADNIHENPTAITLQRALANEPAAQLSWTMISLDDDTLPPITGQTAQVPLPEDDGRYRITATEEYAPAIGMGSISTDTSDFLLKSTLSFPVVKELTTSKGQPDMGLKFPLEITEAVSGDIILSTNISHGTAQENWPVAQAMELGKQYIIRETNPSGAELVSMSFVDAQGQTGQLPQPERQSDGSYRFTATELLMEARLLVTNRSVLTYYPTTISVRAFRVWAPHGVPSVTLRFDGIGERDGMVFYQTVQLIGGTDRVDEMEQPRGEASRVLQSALPQGRYNVTVVSSSRYTAIEWPQQPIEITEQGSNHINIELLCTEHKYFSARDTTTMGFTLTN